jgi:hypothetical protein
MAIKHLTALIGCLLAAPALAQTDFTIVPGVRFGPIRASTTRQALPSLFGATAVQDADIQIGEGFCTEGTRVFPGTADEIEIAWQNAGRSQVAFVRAHKAGGRWRTARGVRIGTPLTDLERLAGHALTFSGFGWDYGGRLEWSEPSGKIVLVLELEPGESEKTMQSPDANAIVGDRSVRSDLPMVRRLRIRVDEISQIWGNPFGEKDCR